MKKWHCAKDGDCCELFSLYTLGYQCTMLKDDRKCKCYKTRPKHCRVDTINLCGLDRDEYLNARCGLVHALKKWHDEFGENSSTKFILDGIANRMAKAGIE
jgi:Fe-S-cluster containining protein